MVNGLIEGHFQIFAINILLRESSQKIALTPNFDQLRHGMPSSNGEQSEIDASIFRIRQYNIPKLTKNKTNMKTS